MYAAGELRSRLAKVNSDRIASYGCQGSSKIPETFRADQLYRSYNNLKVPMHYPSLPWGPKNYGTVPESVTVYVLYMLICPGRPRSSHAASAFFLATRRIFPRDCLKSSRMHGGSNCIPCEGLVISSALDMRGQLRQLCEGL